MARSLNKVTLIGNLTRDPELRYTPSGVAVCSFGLATNRQWRTDSGEMKEDVEFHRVVAWRKLAEICSQLLKKGRKAYVEGRLQTRKWTGQDEVERTTTEIVINEMILLDSSGSSQQDVDEGEDFDIPDFAEDMEEEEDKDEKENKKKKNKSKKTKKTSKGKGSKKESKKKKKTKNNNEEKEDEEDDDIPF